MNDITLLRITERDKEQMLLECQQTPGPHAAVLSYAMIPDYVLLACRGKVSYHGGCNKAALPRNLLQRLWEYLQDIGLAYINHLVEKGEYDLAARKCQKILGKNTELWEFEVYKFKEIGQLKAISRYLPRRDPILKPLIYEMVLHEFLESDYEGFAMLIKEWPGDLYNNAIIVQVVVDHLKKDPQNRTLLRTLAELYTYDQRYGKALEIYLTLRHKDVFQLIHKHNLFSSIRDKIVLLMDFDSEKAVDMLLDNEDKISIDKVVEELENRPELQHVYLHKLFKRDHHKGQRYHEKQISLYAEYDRPNLLPFLRDSTHCPLEKQSAHRSTPELQLSEKSKGSRLESISCQHSTVKTPGSVTAWYIIAGVLDLSVKLYLIGRMGNSRSALKMIMEELNDVDKAIEFAKEQDDGELWEDLILYSIDKPPFITGLLNNIGTHVDPILLIHRIKEGMEIPNLRDSLVKILQDYNLQILLREGCKKILVADSLSLLKKMHRTQMKGIRVDGGYKQNAVAFKTVEQYSLLLNYGCLTKDRIGSLPRAWALYLIYRKWNGMLLALIFNEELLASGNYRSQFQSIIETYKFEKKKPIKSSSPSPDTAGLEPCPI
ncbi:Vacuolar protein sorting-associated protein 41 like protein [Chelonia mydas]|uniref:Vacuolar protein sorting-associated protein 41 like protein n=1 Tax=Chelonia mydas TaxID=8469 RepID=M7BXK4_CHEMY|nr:Vacuolar protein sorting-associated protein 41 like protein [Chelonia mydas]